jgi:hypothetical protein
MYSPSRSARTDVDMFDVHGLVTSEMYTLATCPVKDLQAARADALAHNLPLTEQMKVCE